MTARWTNSFIQHCDDPPFTLSSGGTSPDFVNARRIFEDEHLRERVLSFWELRLSRHLIFEFIPVPTGGDCWAEAMQERFAERGDHYEAKVVVEDVITTGQSAESVAMGRKVPILTVVSRREFGREIAWARIVLP